MKKYIVVILMTILIISAMWISATPENTQEAIEITVIKPSKKNIYDYVNADGRIKEGTRRDVYITRPCEIKKIFVSEGEKVKKGSPLFEIKNIDEKLLQENIYIDEKAILKVFEEYGFDVPSEESFSFVSAETTVITSPIDGIITSLNVNQGENAGVLKKLVSVSDFSDLYIEAQIPEAYSSKIAVGADAKITSEAFGEKFFGGRVESVSPVAQYVPSLTGEGKTYIKSKIRTNSVQNVFKPEISVKARITVNTIENALTLPYECVRQDEEGNEFVFSVESGKMNKRQVITGYELDNEIQIKSGIDENSIVVFNPDEEYVPGSLVKIINIKENK